MFTDELDKISWQETTERIASMTDADVRRALSKKSCDVNDFMALLSPAAEPYLEVMAPLTQIHRGTFWQNHIYVYSALYYQRLYKLMRVLRLS